MKTYASQEVATCSLEAPSEAVFAALDSPRRLSAHMGRRSWRMGWSRIDSHLDELRGQAVGSHIVMSGRVFGLRIYLDEVVTQRDPPARKQWETMGSPRLLVIGAYRLGFELLDLGPRSELRVAIDYDLPSGMVTHLLGRLLGRHYGRWCLRQIVEDARAAFPGPQETVAD